MNIQIRVLKSLEHQFNRRKEGPNAQPLRKFKRLMISPTCNNEKNDDFILQEFL
jgi:hypothetical protein